MHLLPRTGGRVLVVVPTPIEARAVLDGLALNGAIPALWAVFEAHPWFSVVVCGIGKANAAGATAAALAGATYGAVLNVGIAGSLDDLVGLGLVVAARRSVFADEGMEGPGGFDSVESLGFPITPAGMGVECDERLVGAISGIADAIGTIATVSTCSGTDARARETRVRTGAIAESMEGAAVGLAAARYGVPFVELRVISNTTGDRARQRWDLPGGLARLAQVMSRL